MRGYDCVCVCVIAVGACFCKVNKVERTKEDDNDKEEMGS